MHVQDAQAISNVRRSLMSWVISSGCTYIEHVSSGCAGNLGHDWVTDVMFISHHVILTTLGVIHYADVCYIESCRAFTLRMMKFTVAIQMGPVKQTDERQVMQALLWRRLTHIAILLHCAVKQQLAPISNCSKLRCCTPVVTALP